MIFKKLTNLNPMLLCGMAIKIDAKLVNNEPIDYDINCCNSCECDECYPVWGGGEDWQNDKSTFAFIKAITSDTFGFKLYKNEFLVATITDNTYGELVSSYTENPKQYSLVLDWNKVFSAFGFGTYTLQNDYTSLAVNKNFTSQNFCLSEFDPCDVDGWVKLEWFQEGIFLKGGFKFCTPLLHSIKIKSEFFIEAPKTIKDSYVTSNREKKQFRTEQLNQYLLKSKLFSENLLSLLNENLALAEKVTLTDFNLKGTRFVRKELSFVEFPNLSDHSGVRKMNIEVRFEDFTQDIIRDNCC